VTDGRICQRVAIAAVMPIQRTIFAASVRNVKITSAGASIQISFTSESAATQFSRFRFGLGFEPAQAIVPKAVQKCLKLTESLRAHAVEPAGTLTAFVQKASSGQDPQMLGDGGPGGAKVPGDLAGAELTGAHQFEDGHAPRLGDRAQCSLSLLQC
jgi:hypothetical protein